ncbi:FAD-dependent monooxygenase [Rhizobium tumorigenes]|uniref:FAD-dependent monooxygenase n=1 Tax=Rhizobium tumorigenes TaxID=2041385 RepID=UPI00241FB5EF|nr:FAD-dependent monooxygenase [Rhizobium tumorigenes]WFS02237.1 FAD-dependent monooxygenase [Rhizobium tumorigenes]
MRVKTVAIIGAGIAGLTTGLSLARHGIESDIFERSETLTEVGAGLQISPNASRILDELGLLDELADLWLEPEAIRLVSGRSLRQMAAVPSGGFARVRWGAPYGALHRATLQGVLLRAVQANPLCRLHFGAGFDASAPDALWPGGRKPELIVGADGVWSKVRSSVAGSGNPKFSGNIAWRFMVPEAEAPASLDRTSVTAYLGPAAHLVCYPLKEASAFNFVAICAGGGVGNNWSAAASPAQRTLLRQHFAGWNSDLSDLLDRQEDPTVWPLYEVGAGRWHNDRDTVLIGDAAHAMMPFAAQGAAMAIEDAFELAGTVSRQPLAEALVAFEARREPRIARLRKRAAFNRFAYHARGPIRLGRDLVLSLRPPQTLAADLDWIFDYRAIG